MTLSFKKLSNTATIPERKTKCSAGFDLSSDSDKSIIIHPGEIVTIHTGLAVQSSKDDVALLIFGRSGLGAKYGITLANSVGVVDSDYRGEIVIPLINQSKADFEVLPHMRVAQLLCVGAIFADVKVVEDLDDTERGTKGFGSTGDI